MDGDNPVYGNFGDFANADGYSGFVPSSTWLCTLYDTIIEDHSGKIDQRAAMGPGIILAMDHSHKVSLNSSHNWQMQLTLKSYDR